MAAIGTQEMLLDVQPFRIFKPGTPDHCIIASLHSVSSNQALLIIASRDGDLEMTIDASQDGERSIPGWLSFSSRGGFLGWLS